MNNIKQYEFGIREKPQNYEIFKMFSPHAYVGEGGKDDNLEIDGKYKYRDAYILKRFYDRFPGLKLVPVAQHVTTGFSDRGFHQAHPAQTFIKKFRVYKAKGYEQEKAFEMVEAEMHTVFEQQKDEMRVLRGGALALHGNSYLDRAQKISELESQLKMQRFARDIPKFERAQDQSWLEDQPEEEG